MLSKWLVRIISNIISLGGFPAPPLSRGEIKCEFLIERGLGFFFLSQAAWLCHGSRLCFHRVCLLEGDELCRSLTP